MVGYGDAVCVPCEVLEDLFRAAEGRFSIHDPFVLTCFVKVGIESSGIGELRYGTVERELALGKSALEKVDEFSTKDDFEDFERQKETPGSGNPRGLVGRKATAWDYEMDMWVVAEILAPRVQNTEKADFSSQVFGISGELAESLRSRTKEDSVDGSLILKCYQADLFRDRKDEVEVLDG